MRPAPTPIIVSNGTDCRRLIGLELEYDSCNTRFHSPRLTGTGWAEKHDGSLRNGREYVLEPAISFNNVLPPITSFCEAAEVAHTNMGKRGGYHVHVQSHDINIDQCYNLVKIYSKFQNVINRLLAPSRHNNSYCPPYPRNINKEGLINLFRLNSPASNRYDAKCSRAYSVINFAMMRCQVPAERSIEFRQGSPSKRKGNVYGWAALCVALTEIATIPALVQFANECRDTKLGFLKLLRKYEEVTGSKKVAAWVSWRDLYLNAKPSEDYITRAAALLRNPHGIFYIARELNINNMFAKAILEKGVADHKISRVESGEHPKYRSSYECIMENDVTELLGSGQ